MSKAWRQPLRLTLHCWGRLYSVLGKAGASREQTLGMLRGRGRGWGRTVALALLDLKLILRNKRPRQMLGAGLFVIGPFLFIILSGEEIPPMNEVIFGFLLSGYLGLAYTQFSYAWHGTHFDGLLVQATPLRGFVQAQFLTFAGLCVGPLLLVAPIIAGVRPHLLVPIGALLLYNLGVTAPVLLGVGVLGRTALQVDQSAFFNYQGTSTYHFLVVLPIMGLPVGLVIGLSLSTTLYVATGLGVFGLAMAPLWMRGVGWMLRAQRHAMATGFRDE